MTKFLTVKGSSLPVYCLAEQGDQAQGFLGFKEIPATYGLLFLNMNGRSFHMRGVDAPLLACGLTPVGTKGKAFTVASSTIWKPSGKCPYSGTHVLECHPSHAQLFPVGAIVHLEDQVPPARDLRLK